MTNMFIPSHWARAFIDSVEKAGGEAEDGIEILGVFASWITSLPGITYGASAAEKIERLIRKGVKKLSLSGESNISPPVLETATRFLVILLRKNAFRYINLVISEAKKILNKKRGVVTASLEYVFPPEDKSRIKESIKKYTRASRVVLKERVNTDLIGGYRLRIGDEIIDASIRSQLRELEICLSGNGGN